MNKSLLILLLALNYFNVFGQKQLGKDLTSFEKDTVFTCYSVFDYFKQEYDSIVYFTGGLYLMPSDSISFDHQNEYRVVVSSPQNGYVDIYYKEKLLYKYRLINGEINKTGFCYYPFSGDVALQGQFNRGKLDGLVFVQKKSGEIIEVMKYKNGKYIKHVYHWLSFTKKSLKERSKNRSDNPLRTDEVISM